MKIVFLSLIGYDTKIFILILTLALTRTLSSSEELEEEDELLTNLVDAMGHLLKIFSLSFMPVFDSLIVPAFASYLPADQPSPLQIVAVCLIDDAIEFGGAEAHKYIPQGLVTFSRGMMSEDLVLKQSSVYGIAQAVRSAPLIVAPHLDTLVPQLIAIVSDPDASEEENEGITENGLFALGSILTSSGCRSHPWGGVLPAQIASFWLKGLPLRTDDQTAKIANSQLCDIVEKGDPAVLGEGYSNMPELMRIFSEVLMASPVSDGSRGEVKDGEWSEENCLAHPITIRRMQSLVRQLSQG
jgi:hypothetical protein